MGNSRSYFIQNDILYILSYFTLHIYDISDLESPKFVSQTVFGNGAYNFSIKNNTMYINDKIYDITDKQNIHKVGELDIRTNLKNYIKDNFLYIYGGYNKKHFSNSLFIYDITNPLIPKLVHHKKLEDKTIGNRGEFSVYKIIFKDNLMFLLTENGIYVVDITNPKYVETIANYRIKGSSVTGLSLNTNKDILFVATGDKGVLVFNLDILLQKLGY